MILVIGYGNPLRCDDGAGVFVADELLKENIPGIQVITAHQLHVELLEEAIKYEKVILVDAGEQEGGVLLRKVAPGTETPVTSSHHLGPELFYGLAQKIYNKKLDLYVCSIKGENFEVGDKLSPPTLLRAKKALSLIASLFVKDLSYA